MKRDTNTVAIEMSGENTISGPKNVRSEQSVHLSVEDWNGERVFIFLTIDGATKLREALQYALGRHNSGEDGNAVWTDMLSAGSYAPLE